MSSPEQSGEVAPEEGSVGGEVASPSLRLLNGEGVPEVEMVVMDVASDSSN